MLSHRGAKGGLQLSISSGRNRLNGVQRAVATVTVQAMLDVLLLMGHRWDAKPMLSAVLNCWIFYIAACGCLLLQVVLVSSLS